MKTWTAFGVATLAITLAASTLPGCHRGEKNLALAETARRQGLEAARRDALDAALDAFNKAIQFAPSLPSGFTNRARTKHRMHDFEGAKRDFTTAIALGGEQIAWPLALRARLHFDMGNTAEALKDADAAVQAMPSEAMAYVSRSHLRFFVGDTRGALDDLDEARRLRPHLAVAEAWRGFILTFGEAREEALGALRRAVELDPENSVSPALWLFALTGEGESVSRCRPSRPWDQALFDFARGQMDEAALLRAADGAVFPHDRIVRGSEARVVLGAIAERKGQSAAARAQYDAVVALGARNGDYLWAQKRLAVLGAE